MRKYRIIEDSNVNGKAFRPQFKFFLFWYNFSEFKGLYTEIYIYDTLEDAKKRIDDDIRDSELEKECKKWIDDHASWMEKIMVKSIG